MALAPAPLPSSVRPEGGCWEPQPATLAPANRSPGGAGEGTGQRRRGWAGGLGFRGSRWERAWKEQMPPLPTGPARRPPALRRGCSCRRLPRSTAGGKGERHLGHRPLSDSRDTALASPRRPHPASLRPFPSQAWLKDGCLLAAQKLPSQGRGSALEGFSCPD